MIIREVERPTLKDLVGWARRPSKEMSQTEKSFLDGIKFVGSGKGAISIVLRYLSEKKIISSKITEIMVPDWIGYWVYNQMQPFVFPSKKFSDKTKAIFVYHQYGFPQDMDKILKFAREKELIVIEDCAHTLASDYKGKPLGSFGDFSIYSFSKWFFCFALGGVTSRFKDFSPYADKTISNSPVGTTAVKDLAKFLYEWSSFSSYETLKKYTNLFLRMSYSIYGDALKPSPLAVKLCFAKIDHEISVRQQYYSYFLDKTRSLGICKHLESEGVIPYVIPIRCQQAKMMPLVNALTKKGIITGIYQFDTRRNMLSPKFEPCVLIPCNSKISMKTFEDITDTVVKVLE